MTTQHNALLMEMLFSGSMLIIIIVTNLAWEPVSQDMYLDYTATVYLTQRGCLGPALSG